MAQPSHDASSTTVPRPIPDRCPVRYASEEDLPPPMAIRPRERGIQSCSCYVDEKRFSEGPGNLWYCTFKCLWCGVEWDSPPDTGHAYFDWILRSEWQKETHKWSGGVSCPECKHLSGRS